MLKEKMNSVPKLYAKKKSRCSCPLFIIIFVII